MAKTDNKNAQKGSQSASKHWHVRVTPSLHKKALKEYGEGRVSAKIIELVERDLLGE